MSVLTNVDPALRSAWHPVARADEVGDEPTSVRLLGDDWVVVRLPTAEGPRELAAFVDRCPHRLAPLSAGWVDGDVLRCGYHGWCFDAAGACTEIPALGPKAKRPPRAKATLPAGLTERYGLVWLAPETPRVGIIDVPEAESDEFLAADLPVVRAAVGAGLMMDNFLDTSHLPFVHAATIGTPELGTLDDLAVEQHGEDLVGTLEHVFRNHLDPGVAEGVRPVLQRRRVTLTYRPPFTARLRIDFLDVGGANTVTFFVQPEDERSCRMHVGVFRNDLEGDRDRLAAAAKYEQGVLEEDLRLQERYRDQSLPLDLTAEVHVRADQMTLGLRRMLREFVARGDGEEE